MMRTSARPCGAVSRSRSTRSRNPLAGPIPATVYAPPACTFTAVERTGADDALAPARRMATVYSPLRTRS